MYETNFLVPGLSKYGHRRPLQNDNGNLSLNDESKILRIYYQIIRILKQTWKEMSYFVFLQLFY